MNKPTVGIGFCKECHLRIFADENYLKTKDDEMICDDCLEDRFRCKLCDEVRPYCNECV